MQPPHFFAHLALTLLVCGFFWLPQHASASATYDGPLIAGTGVPVAPVTHLPELAAMPELDELELLYALSQTPIDMLPGVLVELGLDSAWWRANLEVSAYEIPWFLPEGSDYDVFVELVHPPSGAQTGCYAKAGTDTWVCIDGWTASASYPQFMTPDEFVDWLFPTAWHMPFGNEVGTSLQWSCEGLRANSDQATRALAYGALGGGSATVAGVFGVGNGSALLAAVYGAAVPAAAFGAASWGSMIWGGIVATGTVVALPFLVGAAVGAGVAWYAYTSGVGPGINCPGCGAGYDPADWDCSADPSTDMCICVPASHEHADGDGGSSTDHDGSAHDPNNPRHDPGGPLGNGWAIGFDEYDSCEEYTNYTADSAECDGCWDDEPATADTPAASATVGAYCRVCTKGTQDSLGSRICITGTIEAAP